MIFVKPKVERWEQKDIWDHAARCARVCYQSVPSKNESNEDFIKRVIMKHTKKESDVFEPIKDHLSVLEHITLKLIIPNESNNFYDITHFYDTNKYSDVVSNEQKNNNIIITNLRVLIENDRIDDLKYNNPSINAGLFERFTFCITTDIGVTREGNRHRVNSISEESTRFCNYHSDRLNKDITYVKVPWINEDCYKSLNEFGSNTPVLDINNRFIDHNTTNWKDIDWYFYALDVASIAYNKLIELGWTPQMARNVLN